MLRFTSYCLIVVALLAIQARANEEETEESEECAEKETIDSTVRVASLRLEEVKIPIIISTFILVVILVKIGIRKEHYEL